VPWRPEEARAGSGSVRRQAQLELRRLLDGEVARLRPVEDLVDLSRQTWDIFELRRSIDPDTPLRRPG
jgi:hypothetical protein